VAAGIADQALLDGEMAIPSDDLVLMYVDDLLASGKPACGGDYPYVPSQTRGLGSGGLRHRRRRGRGEAAIIVICRRCKPLIAASPRSPRDPLAVLSASDGGAETIAH